MRCTFFIFTGLPALLGLGLFPASGLTVTSLQKQLTGMANITVVDVRSPSAYAEEHIPGAINIPASLCPLKKLPPLGEVVVYGDGLGSDAMETTAAAVALAGKPGITADVLEGGFAGWKSSQNLTTRGGGLKHETFNYISYTHLKSARQTGFVLYDLRKSTNASPQVLTDLNTEFPGVKQVKSRTQVLQSVASTASLIVLIDSGDGSAEAEARQLKSGGNHNYVILAGGELTLSRHGQSGLQHNASGAAFATPKPASSGAVK